MRGRERQRHGERYRDRDCGRESQSSPSSFADGPTGFTCARARAGTAPKHGPFSPFLRASRCGTEKRSKKALRRGEGFGPAARLSLRLSTHTRARGALLRPQRTSQKLKKNNNRICPKGPITRPLSDQMLNNKKMLNYSSMLYFILFSTLLLSILATTVGSPLIQVMYFIYTS